MKIITILKMFFKRYKNNPDYLSIKGINRKKIKHNIYGIKNTKKYVSKFIWVHFIFKYRIFCPLLFLIDKGFGHIKFKKIPKADHNYLLVITDKAFEKSLRQWHKFHVNDGELNATPKQTVTKSMNKAFHTPILRSIKWWLFTLLLMDTSYKELFNMFLFNLAEGMQKEFKGRKVNHLMYNGNLIDDVTYLSLFRQVRYDVLMKVHEDKGEKK